MQTLRKYWFDIGGVLALATLAFVYFNTNLSRYDVVVWLSLVSLFLHQLEEYRIVGTFPGMVNTVMYHSTMPDRYPLNSNTALIVNVYVGWTAYLLAAVLGTTAIWLGIATILVSAGNTIAHTTLFNIKGKSIYNAGLATCWLFFVPCIYYFFHTIHTEKLVTTTDYLIGIPLGIILNVSIFKLIDWLADKDTKYIFEQRNLLAKDRK